MVTDATGAAVSGNEGCTVVHEKVVHLHGPLSAHVVPPRCVAIPNLCKSTLLLHSMDFSLLSHPLVGRHMHGRRLTVAATRPHRLASSEEEEVGPGLARVGTALRLCILLAI